MSGVTSGGNCAPSTPAGPKQPAAPGGPSQPLVRVDLHQIRSAATIIYTSIGFIEATLAMLAEQPAVLLVGMVKLPPIIEDLSNMAKACLVAAANYEHNEAHLIPELERQLAKLTPMAAQLAAGVAKLEGIRPTAVAVKMLERLSGKAANNINTLLTRLSATGAIGDIRIEVTALDQAVPGGRPGRHFTVYLPGTQSWSPLPESSVFDLRSNVASMAGQVSAAETATRDALHQAGFGIDDTITLVGYSQGALVGANLISHGLEGKVLGLVSVGAPIDGMELPKEVLVVNLQHTNDPVPKLDLAAPPDNPNWVNLNLGFGGVIGHELDSYLKSVAELSQHRQSEINQLMSGLFDQGRVEIQDWSADRTR